MRSEDKITTITLRVPQGAKTYLLKLAEAHGACNTRNGKQMPSLQVLFRLVASENIKTLRCHSIPEVDADPYPFVSK